MIVLYAMAGVIGALVTAAVMAAHGSSWIHLVILTWLAGPAVVLGLAALRLGQTSDVQAPVRSERVPDGVVWC